MYDIRSIEYYILCYDDGGDRMPVHVKPGASRGGGGELVSRKHQENNDYLTTENDYNVYNTHNGNFTLDY